MADRYDEALRAAMTSKRLPVFDDLADLADSGEAAARVRSGKFGLSTAVWYVVDVDGVEYYAPAAGGSAYEAERLRGDERMRTAVKRTAAVRRLPAVKGTVTVSFKNEDQQGSQVVGPVVVRDHEVYDQDPEVVKAREGHHFGLPFGYKPQGEHNLGWQTRAMARRVARHYHVELEEY